MDVHFPPELEEKLAQSAAQQGREPDELVRQVVARYFDEEGRFVDAVRRGEQALERGEYLTHEEVPKRLALISQLWDSVENDHLPLTAVQQAELDRRLATLDEDRREGVTWAALKAELEQRCS
jgi:putative addiction module component (TIGR02574 family)